LFDVTLSELQCAWDLIKTDAPIIAMDFDGFAREFVRDYLLFLRGHSPKAGILSRACQGALPKIGQLLVPVSTEMDGIFVNEILQTPSDLSGHDQSVSTKERKEVKQPKEKKRIKSKQSKQ
jgi:hypothetical protein